MNSNSQEHSSPRLFYKMKLNATLNLLCKYKKWLHTCSNKMHNINYCSVRTFLFIGNSAPPTNQTLVNLVVVRKRVFSGIFKKFCAAVKLNVTQLKSHTTKESIIYTCILGKFYRGSFSCTKKANVSCNAIIDVDKWKI